MEPKQPSMNRLPELPNPGGQEVQGAAGQPEAVPGNGQAYEQLPEQRFEQMPAPQEQLAPPPIANPLPPMPAPAAPQTAPQMTAQPVTDNTPSVANDDDLIEKEWVEKAKQVIADTKEDPALRESEIQKLQLDYIKKRYGREIGGSSELGS